jgi:hypothetical protein
MQVIGKTLLFAAAALLVSVLLDLGIWGGYQGLQPEAQRESLLLVHASIHGSVFVAAFVAAVVSFGLLRNRLPSSKTTAILGLLYGVVALFAAVAAMASFGPVAGGGTLLAVAVFFTAGGGLAFGEKLG